MLAAERRNHIVRLLSSTGTVTVSQLSDEFGVTAETIRRIWTFWNKKTCSGAYMAER